jgi:methionyl-tRNA synthetase
VPKPASRFYITTAIDYPNAAPHIGHAYEKIVADAYARWYRMMGSEVFFVTGTDENGQKLEKAAKEQGVPTQEFVDNNSEKFRELCRNLSISHDQFIRTTEPRHLALVAAFWRKLQAKGDIYFDKYKGNYCYACEAFYSEAQAPEGKCPVHEKPLNPLEEDGYFFRLSRYQEQLLALIKSKKDFIFPRSSRLEILSRLESESLLDLSISRPNGGWGIPVPEHKEHVIYTWFDALLSYISGTFDDAKAAAGIVSPHWPATMQVIGKDIAWFHAVIWPAMLMAAELPLPGQIYVHGMILGFDGRRMSKSAGNGVDPQECLEKYPLDSLRFSLLKGVSSGQDGAYGVQDLEKMHNTELANELGNLFSRSIKLAIKNFGAQLAPPPTVDIRLDLLGPLSQAMEQREHHRALGLIWEGVRELNAYLNEKEPWRIKDDPAAVQQILYTVVANLYQIAMLLRPFIPASAEKALAALGEGQSLTLDEDFFTLRYTLRDEGALFPRIM